MIDNNYLDTGDTPGIFYEPEVYNLELASASKREFNIDSRYFSLSIIGKGAYGVVA